MKQLDLTKPVQTEGSELSVRILCTDADLTISGASCPIIALVPGMYVGAWQSDGTPPNKAQLPRLINAPVKRRVTGWLNVYPDGTTSAPHRSKKAADGHCLSTRIACIHIDIEYTEGDGLDGAQ